MNPESRISDEKDDAHPRRCSALRALRAGSGTSLIRITAGAVHGDKLPAGVPASHGYSFAAVVPGENNTLRLRVWPRRWSEKNKHFTVDTDNTPKDRPYAGHTLPGMTFKP